MIRRGSGVLMARRGDGTYLRGRNLVAVSPQRLVPSTRVGPPHRPAGAISDAKAVTTEAWLPAKSLETAHRFPPRTGL
jgi:hypothetical protein